MLYERWRQVVSAQPDALALTDQPAGRRWTFHELAREAEARPPAPGPVVHPTGATAEFVLAVLRGWRASRVVCPLEPGQTPPPAAAAGRETPALPAGCVHLKLTSATTGAPRLVAFTAEQLAADARHIVAGMGLRPDRPNVAAISLAHSYGFSNLILPLLLEGIPLVLAGGSLPEAVRRAARNAAEITLPGVPALWRAWHEADAIPPQTRLAISAGAPLPVELERAIHATRGLKVHNFYGATECGGIAYDASDTPREATAEAGAPLTGVRLTVGDEGCLEVRGENVALGYWPEPDARLGDGVFRTGDLAEWRGRRLWLRGRAGAVINVAGRKLAPEIVEAALLGHPGVRECVVFGVPAAEGGRGEEAAAVVVARAGADEAVLRAHLLARLPAWQVPRRWWLTAGPLANARGKISRPRWREKFLARRLPGPSRRRLVAGGELG